MKQVVEDPEYIYELHLTHTNLRVYCWPIWSIAREDLQGRFPYIIVRGPVRSVFRIEGTDYEYSEKQKEFEDLFDTCDYMYAFSKEALEEKYLRYLRDRLNEGEKNWNSEKNKISEQLFNIDNWKERLRCL